MKMFSYNIQRKMDEYYSIFVMANVQNGFFEAMVGATIALIPACSLRDDDSVDIKNIM